MDDIKDLMEGRRILVSAVMEAEGRSVAQKVPEKGVFSPVSWALAYYGTEHEGRLYVQFSQEHGCMIRASMIPERTGAEISNYVFYGSKQECLRWLQDPSHVEELLEIYNHLAEKADAYGN